MNIIDIMKSAVGIKFKTSLTSRIIKVCEQDEVTVLKNIIE